MNTSTGEKIVEGTDENGSTSTRSCLDYFLATVPPDQLNRIATLTTAELLRKRFRQTDNREKLKFFGIVMNSAIVLIYGVAMHLLFICRHLTSVLKLECHAYDSIHYGNVYNLVTSHLNKGIYRLWHIDGVWSANL